MILIQHLPVYIFHPQVDLHVMFKDMEQLHLPQGIDGFSNTSFCHFPILLISKDDQSMLIDCIPFAQNHTMTLMQDVSPVHFGEASYAILL
jgi:hypothetical protein